MGSSTGAPFSLAIPDDDDLATFVLDYLNPNLIALNSNAVHRTGAVVLSGGKRYTSSGLTLTSDTPILDAAVTFNAPGVVLNAAVVNVTDTASHANSTLLDLKVAGTSKASVRKDGLITTAAGIVVSAGGITATGTSTFVGNVGVGVTPSAWAATLRALQIGQAGLFYADTASASIGIGSNFYNDGANKAIVTGAASYIGQNAGAITFNTAPSVTAGNALTFTERLRVSDTGAAVFGSTLDPTQNLRVSGAMSGGAGTSPAGLIVAPTLTKTGGGGNLVGVQSGGVVAVNAAGANAVFSLVAGGMTGTNAGTIPTYSSVYITNGGITGGTITNSYAIYHGDTGANLSTAGAFNSVSNEFLPDGTRHKTRLGLLADHPDVVAALGTLPVRVHGYTDPTAPGEFASIFAEELRAVSPWFSDGHTVNPVVLASAVLAYAQSLDARLTAAGL